MSKNSGKYSGQNKFYAQKLNIFIFKKFYGRHHDLLDSYNATVSRIISHVSATDNYYCAWNKVIATVLLLCNRTLPLLIQRFSYTIYYTLAHFSWQY